MDNVFKSYNYYLYHNSKKVMVEKLSWTQLNAFCRLMDKSHYTEYLLWIAEKDEWKSLDSMIDQVLIDQGHSLPKSSQEKERVESEMTAWNRGEKENKRFYARFSHRIPVTVDVRGSLINTHTLDVGYGGVKLDSFVPTREQYEYVFFYIFLKEEYITFKVRPIYSKESKGGFNRLEIEKCSDTEKWKSIVKNVAIQSESI